jgi:DNA-binding SARP family transcriptional activator
VGAATIAHVTGDSDATLEALRDAGEEGLHWRPTVEWFRSVAHRRNGDLDAAHRALDAVAGGPGPVDSQHEVARLRIRWLEGEVDHVAEGADAHYEDIKGSGDRFLVREAAHEAAARLAWLGEVERARHLVAEAPVLSDVPSVLADVLRGIAVAAIAVEEGDERRAADLLGPVALDGPGAIGRPESWYWYDRAAVALVHVLVPDTRPAWTTMELAGPMAVGRRLAEALEAARAGDLERVRRLEWPSDGLLRAHLPRRWVAELREAGERAGRPATTEVANRPVPAPDAPLSVAVCGPLTIRRDGRVVESANLRRGRVRELLCFLVAHRRCRREVVAEELWPDSADGAHNLRVTLNYLLQALEPDRGRNERPTFVQVEGGWLGLADDGRVRVDLWELEALLEQVNRAGDEPQVIEQLRAILPMWSGEPLADVPYALWAEPIRFRLRTSYVSTALRVAELLLDADTAPEAGRAARHALTADPTCEPAYRWLAHSHLLLGDVTGARAVLVRCREVLADLGVQPDDETRRLEREIDSR